MKAPATRHCQGPGYVGGDAFLCWRGGEAQGKMGLLRAQVCDFSWHPRASPQPPTAVSKAAAEQQQVFLPFSIPASALTKK